MDLYNKFIKNIEFKNNNLLIALIGTDRFFAGNYKINVFNYIFDVNNMLKAEVKAF